MEFKALLPYERGDLINRLHQHGEIDSMEHTADGTLVAGRANEDLAGELAYVRRLTRLGDGDPPGLSLTLASPPT